MNDSHKQFELDFAKYPLICDPVYHYRELVRRHPDDPMLHCNYGLALMESGDFQGASKCFHRAIELRPDHSPAYNALGIIAIHCKNLSEAIDWFRQAVGLGTISGDAYNNLGNALRKSDKPDEAISVYRQGIGVAPTHPQIWLGLGDTLYHSGRYAEAYEVYIEALNLNRSSAVLATNAGNALRQLKRFKEAETYYRRAIQADPNYAPAYNNLGNLLRTLRRHEEALEHFRNANRLHTGNKIILNNLGTAYATLEMIEESIDCYKKAVFLEKECLAERLRIDSLCPAVFQSADEIFKYRARLTRALEYYAGQDHFKTTITECATVGCGPSFKLLYHGEDERPIRELYASIFNKCNSESTDFTMGSQRPRVGCLVTGGHAGMFVRANEGLLNNLNTNRIDFTVICADSDIRFIRQYIHNPGVSLMPVPEDFQLAAIEIRKAYFDLLYYWEIGTNSQNYFLPFLRLAPVQILGQGTQCTSGISQVDYIISSELCETDEADEHYTEKLARLKALPYYQRRPQLPENPPDRAAFGLPDSRHIYLCAQNLVKIHPDFDKVIQEILLRDPYGVLVLVESELTAITNPLKKRFARSLSKVLDRIYFVPRMNIPSFLSLIALSDVVLDTFHYGGTSTAYDALGLGKPIITLPMKYQRGRYTYACYRKMCLFDCIAESPEHYVELALRTIADESFSHYIQEQIAERNAVLFESSETLLAYEQFFEDAVETYRKN
jgi:protein O-GlcNAc transferase